MNKPSRSNLLRPAVPDPTRPLAPAAGASSSYKCEECGKIIAAPAANPTPVCCGEPMTKIR